MSVVTITRTYWFCAAHRIQGHPKCGRMHGHNYRVDVTVSAEYMSQGMVMDFTELDNFAKPVIEELDHHYLTSVANRAQEDPYRIDPRDYVDLEVEETTAELMSIWISNRINRSLHTRQSRNHLRIERVDLWETPKSKASFIAVA